MSAGVGGSRKPGTSSRDLIHALMFECAFDVIRPAPESVEVADWVKADLLPVIEAVLEGRGAARRRRRIARIEIDLGTVSVADAHGELPRRLLEHLTLALAQAETGGQLAAADAGAEMLEFLGSGALPWSPAGDSARGEQDAQDALLRDLLDTPDALTVFTKALGEPHMASRLIRQFDTESLLAVAAALFEHWPAAERQQALRWSADTLGALQQAAAPFEPFWRWLLAQHAQPAGLQELRRRWHQASDGHHGVDYETAIALGLRNADFDVLEPHWQRLLADAPDRLREAHASCHRAWLRGFDDAVLTDILGVVQADCGWLLDLLSALLPRAQLAAQLAPAMAAWLAAPLDTVSPRALVDTLLASAPTEAGRIVALFAGEAAADSAPTDASPAAAPGVAVFAQAAGATAPFRAAGAVDSKRLREALQVLGAVFTRAEIITISACLNAGTFAPLAPYWDRLLVLAPHWLRSEYPHLARSWLAGFDIDVLIDILAVVQAECCALIEQLASALPRERLHAALQPFMARWFEIDADQLAPAAVVDAVLGAEHAADDVPSLHDLLAAADMVQLQRRWPAIVLSQRGAMRKAWAGLPDALRVKASAAIAATWSPAQQLEIALILHPALAPLLAELRRLCAARGDGAAILASTARLLLGAGTGQLVPRDLVKSVLAEHPALRAELPQGLARHASAVGPVRSAELRGDRAIAQAQASEPAWRALIEASHAADAGFGNLNSAQLHALVRAWDGFQQQGREKAHAQEDGGFLRAVETVALRSAAPHVVFGQVLERVLRGAPVDLDDIAAHCGATGRSLAGAGDLPPDVTQVFTQMAVQVRTPLAAPLPESMLARLPQRLADAMLRADLSALDAHWAAIVDHHPAMLAQAAQRYLGRAEAMHRLIANAGSARMQDVLACLSAPAAALIAPLLAGAASFSHLLPGTLSQADFEQRLLRFTFARVMGQQTPQAPAEFVAGLLEALLQAPAGSVDCAASPLAHAFYESLRGDGSALEALFQETLFGAACLTVALQRLQKARADAVPPAEGVLAGPDRDSALPDPVAHLLMRELCERHAALTDQLVAGGPPGAAALGSSAAVFSAAEWRMLAAAQMPRQQTAAQQAFWRAHAACLADAGAAGGSDHQLQAAFAAAFNGLERPAPTTPAGAIVAASPVASAGAMQVHAGGAAAETIAVLLMRAQEPDQIARAGVCALTERFLAAPGDSADHAPLQSALSHHAAVERLTSILPAPTLARLLCVLQPALATALPTLLRDCADSAGVALSSVPAMLDGATWRAVYSAAFCDHQGSDSGTLAAGLRQRIARAELPSAPERSAAMAQLLLPLAKGEPRPVKVALAHAPLPFSADANLRNAGMVLIAPYVERLFALLDITSEGRFVDDQARQRGVHLLQYVITAEQATPEYLLALNKLLCGIPGAEPVLPGIVISEREKTVIGQMLQGVIANWSAIGDSSVAGLRETFLQREGSLYLDDENWQLKIPQGTFDMLLDRLPWSYKLIKFSWMPAPLHVSWR